MLQQGPAFRLGFKGSGLQNPLYTPAPAAGAENDRHFAYGRIIQVAADDPAAFRTQGPGEPPNRTFRDPQALKQPARGGKRRVFRGSGSGFLLSWGDPTGASLK